jgi:hypothetical protein
MAKNLKNLTLGISFFIRVLGDAVTYYPYENYLIYFETFLKGPMYEIFCMDRLLRNEDKKFKIGMI